MLEDGICPQCDDANMTDGHDLCSWCMDNPEASVNAVRKALTSEVQTLEQIRQRSKAFLPGTPRFPLRTKEVSAILNELTRTRKAVRIYSREDPKGGWRRK